MLVCTDGLDETRCIFHFCFSNNLVSSRVCRHLTLCLFNAHSNRLECFQRVFFPPKEKAVSTHPRYPYFTPNPSEERVKLTRQITVDATAELPSLQAQLHSLARRLGHHLVVLDG